MTTTTFIVDTPDEAAAMLETKAGATFKREDVSEFEIIMRGRWDVLLTGTRTHCGFRLHRLAAGGWLVVQSMTFSPIPTQSKERTTS